MSIHPLRPRDHEDAASVAIDWLSERHRKGWLNAFEQLLDDWAPEEPEGLDDDDGALQLDEDALAMASINAGEWLIARGDIHARGGPREINSYLLGPGGPHFTPGQRDWIAQLRARPLRLYRVTQVQPGVGLTLVDELDPQAEPLTVRDVAASHSAQPGLLTGARAMWVDPGATGQPHWELSGATYPFAKLQEGRALAQVGDALQAAAQLGLNEENRRDLAEMAIARAWLAQWLDPAPLPVIQDAATGEPMLLVTDHYRVLDAAALDRALASEDDVERDAGREGDSMRGWTRTLDLGDGLLRLLCSISPGPKAGRITVVHRNLRHADEGRAWLEALAGQAVQHLTREIVDLAGHMASEDRAARKGGKDRKGLKTTARPSSRNSPDLPPEDFAQLAEQFIHRHYAHWADESIPALGGLTPRQAIQTPRGLELVKGLLRMYEQGEREQSADQGRPPVSYQFLWDALGIAR